jgi:transcriptional regulator with XRE-family HTH domain
MSLGQFLKSLREQRSLGVRELERRSGVPASYITNIESGKRDNPSPDILKKLAGPLGVPYEKLMIEAGYLEEKWDLDKCIESIPEEYYIDVIAELSRRLVQQNRK